LPAASRRAFDRRLFRRSFQETVQAGPSNAQDLRRAHPVSVAQIENPLDVIASDFIERQRRPARSGRGRAAARFLQVFWKIGQIDEFGAGRDCRSSDQILQLANISRPIMLQQGDSCPPPAR
jgi:hypothetical protein